MAGGQDKAVLADDDAAALGGPEANADDGRRDLVEQPLDVRFDRLEVIQRFGLLLGEDRRQLGGLLPLPRFAGTRLLPRQQQKQA